MTAAAYDAILVLGGGINLDGSLSTAAKNQVEAAVKLFKQHSPAAFIASGLYGYKGDEKPVTSEARAYTQYAEQLGVDHDSLYIEERSQETLGNILFTKTQLLIPYGWKRIIVVPQVNHLTERVEYLLQKVLGPEYKWTIVRPSENLDSVNVARETKSLEMTRDINDAFSDGDHDTIYKALMESHPAYGGTRWTVDELRAMLGTETKKHVIGIIGTIGAGKDTAGDYIASKLHIPTFQISSPLKQICQEAGVEPTRDNLIALGTKLAAEHGDGYLADYILERMPQEAIITGMRQLGQIETLRAKASLTLISIDADPAIRFERVTQNAKLGEASNLDEFVSKEIRENSAPNAQRLFECMEMAEYRVVNEGSLEDFYSELDKIPLGAKEFPQ